MNLVDNQIIPEMVGIWGGGLIGLSSAAHFAREGVRSIILDIDVTQVARINKVVFPPNFEEWVGFPIKGYIESGHVRATTDASELSRASVKIHFVAVPTERNGEPYMNAIDSVMQQLTKELLDLCIIESTAVPGQTENLSKKYGLALGVATRRDWFTSTENNLENCVRVFAGVNEDVTDRMQSVLSVLCKRLARASSCTVVELTKCLDNGFFHTVAMYASQVASAYPNANVAEALKLAATHWRLGNHVFLPSLGAAHPNKLTIATDAVQYDASNPLEVAARIKQQLKAGDRVAILGSCYRGDIRVHIESPHLKFTGELLTGGTAMCFPEDLNGFQFVYVGANHSAYVKKVYSVLAYMRRGQCILDNQGIWEMLANDARSLGMSYHRVGDPGWMEPRSNTQDNTAMTPVEGDDVNKEERVVFETKWFRIHAIPNATSSNPYFVIDRPDSATTIPLSPSGRMILQKQHRPHIGRSSWEFPMGSIDPGESAQQAAKRELLEETGLTCKSVEQIGFYYVIPGLATQRTYLFVAHITDEQLDNPQVAVEEGISAFQIVDLPGFRALAAAAEIIDGFTLAAFTLWQSVIIQKQ